MPTPLPPTGNLTPADLLGPEPTTPTHTEPSPLRKRTGRAHRKKAETPRRSVTAEKREAIARLHARGLGRNEIAAEVDLAPSTVSKHAAALGLAFDTSRTEAATEVAKRNLAALREEIVYGAHVSALELQRQVNAPSVAVVVADGAVSEHRLSFAQSVDQKNRAIAFGIMADKLVALAAFEAASSTPKSDVHRVLDFLMGRTSVDPTLPGVDGVDGGRDAGL